MDRQRLKIAKRSRCAAIQPSSLLRRRATSSTAAMSTTEDLGTGLTVWLIPFIDGAYTFKQIFGTPPRPPPLDAIVDRRLLHL